MVLKADIVLIDARNLLWRSFEANAMLQSKTKNGIVPTGGIYGSLHSLIRLRKRFPACKLIVAWESRTNRRRDAYPSYKEKTDTTPEYFQRLEEFKQQEKFLKKILLKLGVSQYFAKGFEADDVIGTVAKKGAERGLNVVIFSNDGDMHQLVERRVKVLAPGQRGNEKVFDIEAVVEKWGVSPGGLPDVKALAGDSSDNIPGIKGIGVKTAARLVDNFEDVEGVIDAAHFTSAEPWPVHNKFIDMIDQQKEDVRLFKRLTTINTNVKVQKVDVKPLKKSLNKLFLELRLKSFLFGDDSNLLHKLGV